MVGEEGEWEGGTERERESAGCDAVITSNA